MSGRSRGRPPAPALLRASCYVSVVRRAMSWIGAHCAVSTLASTTLCVTHAHINASTSHFCVFVPSLARLAQNLFSTETHSSHSPPALRCTPSPVRSRVTMMRISSLAKVSCFARPITLVVRCHADTIVTRGTHPRKHVYTFRPTPQSTCRLSILVTLITAALSLMRSSSNVDHLDSGSVLVLPPNAACSLGQRTHVMHRILSHAFAPC